MVYHKCRVNSPQASAHGMPPAPGQVDVPRLAPVSEHRASSPCSLQNSTDCAKGQSFPANSLGRNLSGDQGNAQSGRSRETNSRKCSKRPLIQESQIGQNDQPPIKKRHTGHSEVQRSSRNAEHSGQSYRKAKAAFEKLRTECYDTRAANIELKDKNQRLQGLVNQAHVIVEQYHRQSQAAVLASLISPTSRHAGVVSTSSTSATWPEKSPTMGPLSMTNIQYSSPYTQGTVGIQPGAAAESLSNSRRIEFSPSANHYRPPTLLMAGPPAVTLNSNMAPVLLTLTGINLSAAEKRQPSCNCCRSRRIIVIVC